MEGWPSTFAIHSIQLCSRVARFGCVSSHQEEEKKRHFESGGPWLWVAKCQRSRSSHRVNPIPLGVMLDYLAIICTKEREEKSEAFGVA